jgi:2-polyprenyl-3-methyl-5-hydroxy-6-metoxy-1,4-benzoquinol methylase
VTKTKEHEVKKRKAHGEKRIKLTGEVFTPIDLCVKIVREIPVATLRNPEATFLDNSCGDGNFLVALLKVLSKYHDREHVLNNMIYGVDLMPDNVETAKERLGLTPDMVGWHHVVCADGLSYDYEFAPPQAQSSMVEEF